MQDSLRKSVVLRKESCKNSCVGISREKLFVWSMFFSESESETLALGISMSTYRRLDSDKVSIECHLKLNRCFGAALVRVI